ncbi:MAG: F0F1 ATP synthase subunit epsilon [Methylacidiphilales bacterium]|nr:F0F1 ATP synthase subunit epsilon [Candidatus Methylacidiphilales bacterium]
MATLKLEIITPESKIFDDNVDEVLLPGSEGDMGILPKHENLVTDLKAGELRYKRNGQVETLAIGEGFAEITGDSVAVLTDAAVREADIDVQVAEEAVKRAEELLKSNTLEGEELEATQAALARSLAQIHIKRRHRG